MLRFSVNKNNLCVVSKLILLVQYDTGLFVFKRQTLQMIPRPIHVSLIYCVSITVCYTSALICALSLSKCHLVSSVFFFFLNKEIYSQVKRVRHIQTLRPTVCYLFECCCFVFFVLFLIFLSPVFYFGLMQHYEIILRTETQLKNNIRCWKRCVEVL